MDTRRAQQNRLRSEVRAKSQESSPERPTPQPSPRRRPESSPQAEQKRELQSYHSQVLQLQDSIRARERDSKAALREKDDRISLLLSEVATLKSALAKEKENGENLRLTLTQLHRRVKSEEERIDETAKKELEIDELRRQNAELFERLEKAGIHRSGTPLDPSSAQLATQVEIQRIRIRELEQQQTELLRTMAKLRNHSNESSRKAADLSRDGAQTKVERPQTPPKVIARPVTPPQRIRSVSPLTRLSSSTPSSTKAVGLAYRSSPSQIKQLVETAGFSQPTASSHGARPRLPSPVSRSTTNQQPATVSIVIRPTMISAIRSENAAATAFPTTYRPTRLVRHHAWEDPSGTKL